MREQKMGLAYFCIDTDIKDDDKVFDLRYRFATKDGGYDAAAGYAAFGRFVDLLADIYREGFAAEMTLQRRVRLAQQLGLSNEELDEFVSVCVDVGLFDRALWESHKVLTSRGIQRRYYIVASRRTGSIPESQRRWFLDDSSESEAAEDDGGKMSQDVDTMQHDVATLQHDVTSCDSEGENGKKPQVGHSATSCMQDVATLQHDAEPCPLIEEKRREEEKNRSKTEEEEKENRARKTEADFDGLARNLTRGFTSSMEKRSKAKRHEQPYPLSCLSGPIVGQLFDDGMDQKYASPWDAIVRHLRYKAPDCDVQSFATAVAATCPVGCAESDECVQRCFDLISQTLDKFDRRVCASPIPLVRKVLTEDREG